MAKIANTASFNIRLFATITLIVINIGFFAGVYFSGNESAATLLKIGAQSGLEIWRGEYWRFVTTIFLHIDIVHLFFNMYALLILGQFVEPLLGRRNFIALYFLSGISGGILSVLIHPQYTSVGASGAVFGLAGAALAARVLFAQHLANAPAEFRRTSHRQTILLLGIILYNLLIGFMMDFIDNAAHVGGLVGGFISGYYYLVRRWGDELRLSKARFFHSLFLAVLLAALFYSSRPVYNSQWCLFYADNMRLMGRDEEAEKYYRRAVHIASRKPNPYKKLGEFLLSQNKTQDALDFFKAALLLGGETGELNYWCGVAHLILNQPEEAYQNYKASLKGRYYTSRKLILLGHYYRKIGEYEKALDSYFNAIRMDALDSDLYQALLYFFTRPGEKVNPALMELIKSNTGYVPDFFQAAYYLHYCQFDRALELYKKTLAQYPEAFFIHHKMAWCCLNLEKYQEADTSVNQFLAGIPDLNIPGIAAQRNIGLMLKMRIAQKQKNEKAYQELRDIIEKNYRAEIKHERLPIFLNNLAWHCAEENYNLDEAIQLAREATAKSPRAYNLDTLAWACFRAGKLDEALKTQIRAIEKAEKEEDSRWIMSADNAHSPNLQADEGLRSFHYHLAAIYAALDQKDKALEFIEKALADGADFEDYESALALREELQRK